MSDHDKHPRIDMIATEEKVRDNGEVWHYHIVVLRNDALEKIRQIVREEIDRRMGAW